MTGDPTLGATADIPPVLFLVFNRPDTTARVFEAIRQARPPRLYVAADGPRPDRAGEAERCAEVRRIATAVDWPCEVRTLFRDANLGCRRAVSGAITWFFEHEPEGIILEDDCLPHPDFFRFCGELLGRYRDDGRIAVITGDNFQNEMDGYGYSYYYSIFNHCWGWASWRRAWQHYDAELATFEPTHTAPVLRRMVADPAFSDYWLKRFEQVRAGAIDSWAYIWTYSCWMRQGWTCTPRANLVTNIGFGVDATHTTKGDSAVASLPMRGLAFPLDHPPEVVVDKRFDAHVVRHHFGIRARRGWRHRLQRKAASFTRWLREA